MIRYLIGLLTLPALFVLWMLCEYAHEEWVLCKMRREIRRAQRDTRRAWAELDSIRGHQLLVDVDPSWDPPSAALVTEPDPVAQTLRAAYEKRHREVVDDLNRMNSPAYPKKGGYSGSVPAKDVPPPPSTPSETIRPRTNRVPNPLVGENLSEYIDGEVRRAAMWAEPTLVFMDGNADEATSPISEGWPDPDKADCPVWLPRDPRVPHKDRTPCCLDSGHDEDHEPMDKGTLERAEAIAKRVRYGSWDAAAAAHDAEQATDIARHRRWVQLTVIGSPPIGLPIRQADPLEVHNAIAPLLGFELVSSVAATVLDTPAAVND